jgi:hypothetical protein
MVPQLRRQGTQDHGEGETRDASGHHPCTSGSMCSRRRAHTHGAAAQVFLHLHRSGGSRLLSRVSRQRSSSSPWQFSRGHLSMAVLVGRLPTAALGGGAWQQPPRVGTRQPPPRGGAQRRRLAAASPRQHSSTASPRRRSAAALRAALAMRGQGLGGVCVCGQESSRWGRHKCDVGVLPFL